MIFQGVIFSCSDVLTKENRCRELFCLSSNLVLGDTGAQPKNSHWSPPQFGVIKVNVDAAVYPLMDHFGVGVVGRDNSGTLFCAEGKYLRGSFSPLLAELIVTQVGISRAISMGWNSIIIEFDASIAVEAIL